MTFLFALACTVCLSLVRADEVERTRLDPEFGLDQHTATERLIERVAGADAHRAYLELDAGDRGPFLDRFWSSRNPLLHRYYYGYYLGKRRFTVSDSFFEQGELVPKMYHVDSLAPDSATVSQATELTSFLVAALPDDPIALNARGYVLLEAGKGFEAEPLFLRACELQSNFAEARNGWGLSYLLQKKRLIEGLYHFRDAIATDGQYEGAWYNLAMCHLAMGSIDIDHRFGQVVGRFPNHHDAYHKLGVVFEELYDYKRAAGAYSSQLMARPDHRHSRARLARVNLEMSWMRRRHYDIPDVEALVEQDPQRYLPLLAATYLAKEDYAECEETYDRYLRLISANMRAHFEDISLLATREELAEIERAVHAKLKQAAQARIQQAPRPGTEKTEQVALPDPRAQRIRQFWLGLDPTPVTRINERKLEHYRRVHYALRNFGLGTKPWDVRGDVYIRLGHPNHRSWSGNLVFETDPKAVRVKNRLNDLVHRAKREITPTDRLLLGFLSDESGDLRGVPIFPVPHRGSPFAEAASLNARWELWIYGDVLEGVEITFVDGLGDGRYDFARPPQTSSFSALWQSLAPETIYARAVAKSPSHYTFDYKGAPLDLYVDHAVFRDEDRSAIEIYVGVPWAQLGLQLRGNVLFGQLERTVVVYDENTRPVYTDTVVIAQGVPDDQPSGPGTLMVDQVRVPLAPGTYFVAVEVRDPGTQKTQALLQRVEVEKFQHSEFSLSEVEVAAQISDANRDLGRQFIKEELTVLPLPSRIFSQQAEIYLYYEVYNLLRNRDGQSRYRVDYHIRGGKPKGARRLLGGIARLIGSSSEGEELRVSYEHEGFSASEPMYIALDVDPVDREEIEVAVRVTDLMRNDEPTAIRKVGIMRGK
jgi:GWxTD domain-containing protein